MLCNQVLSAQAGLFSSFFFSEAGRKLRARVKELLLESLLCSPISGSKLLCGRALEQTDLHRTGNPQPKLHTDFGLLPVWLRNHSHRQNSGITVLSTLSKCYYPLNVFTNLSSYASLSYKAVLE